MSPVRDSRRARDGVFYTPPTIVGHILRYTLDAWLAQHGEVGAGALRLLDPACGDGAFLVEAYRRLLNHACGDAPPRRNGNCRAHHLAARLSLLRECVFGVDVDEEALQTARRRLAATALGVDEGAPQPTKTPQEVERLAASLEKNLCCGDALDPSSESAALALAHWRPGAFQVIVANPPFVGARRWAMNLGHSLGERFQTRYRCARGSCDLYVLFLERIYELLAEGGRFGVVAPNKIALADYARPVRELLLTQARLDRIDDISRLRAFPAAGVYPVIVCGEKRPPDAAHRLVVTRPPSLASLNAGPRWTIRQSKLDAAEGFPLQPALDVESRVPTKPLGAVATLHSGTTGFAAHRLAQALVERQETPDEAWDFITTGNIDRYCIRLGRVRFMRRSFSRPVLPASVSFLSERKRRLYREAKIVVAGMSRRPEAAWSGGGLALGVQTYALAQWREDPFFLLALLNSAVFAYLFRTRFQAKRMAGGYLAVNKSQWQRLPVRIVGPTEMRARRLRDELAEAGFRFTHALAGWRRIDGPPASDFAGWERRVDAAVCELYGLDECEIAMIDEELADTPP